MAETLEANPGSIRLDENTILFEQGITATLPLDGEMSTQAATQCARGWLCVWPDANFEAPALGIPACVFADLFEWWYHPVTGAVARSPEVLRPYYYSSPGPDYRQYALHISSVFNNLQGVPWAALYSSFSNRNYYAHEGDPDWYVGDFWNDQFIHAWGC